MLCISSALFAPANKSAKLESSGWADIGSLAEIDEGRNSNKTTPRNLCDAISCLTTLGNKTFWVSIAEAIFIVILLTASGWQYDDGDMCTWGVGRPCLENEEVHSFFFYHVCVFVLHFLHMFEFNGPCLNNQGQWNSVDVYFNNFFLDKVKVFFLAHTPLLSPFWIKWEVST